MSTSSNRTIPKYQALIDAMERAGLDVDVPIVDLYRELSHWRTNPSPKQAQILVGAFVTYANSRLEGLKIVPGRLKRTYRLVKEESSTVE